MYLKSDASKVWSGWIQMAKYLEHNLTIYKNADGIYYEDQEGKKYIDGISNLLSSNLGHKNKNIAERIIMQLNKLDSCTLIGASSDISIEYADKITNLLNGDFKHVFFTNSGSEGADTAIKIAKQYFYNEGKASKSKIITLKDSYHGSTIAAICASGNEYNMRAFGDKLTSFLQVNGPSIIYKPKQLTEKEWCEKCLKELEEAILGNGADNIAAVMLEPVQLSNAVSVFHNNYFLGVKKLCDKYNVLLIVDEVATGFGRTGNIFAYKEWGIVPDIVIVSKAITNGVIPLGGVMVTEKIYEQFLGDYNSKRELSHGYTSSGNPLACAAAIATLEVLCGENIIANVKAKSISFISEMKKLENFRFIDFVQGKGYMIGIKVNESFYTSKYPDIDLSGVIVALIKSKGLITYYDGGGKIFIAPPLICNEQDLEKIFKIIKGSLQIIDQLFDLKERKENREL